MKIGADERGALVVFPEAHGVQYWHSRNAASPIPGEWPYGLDALSEYGSVRTTEVPNRGLAVRMAHQVAGPRRLRSGGGEVEVALCWNEATVLPMLASVRAKRMVSGVIWVTDEIASRAQGRQIAMIRRGLREMDALWCLSRPQVDRIREWLAGDGPVVHFLRFGVDSKFYAPVPYPERPLVASVGGDRDRDPGTLLEALGRVTRARPDVRCVVQSRSAVSAPRGVEVIPSLPHVGVRDLLGRATVVAVATRPNWHASGITVSLEAMSIGRPVVGSGTPGMDDYVEVGKTGNLVRPQDPEALAEAILDLLDDPDRAAEWGANGTRAVQENYTTAVMCRSLADIVWS